MCLCKSSLMGNVKYYWVGTILVQGGSMQKVLVISLQIIRWGPWLLAMQIIRWDSHELALQLLRHVSLLANT